LDREVSAHGAGQITTDGEPKSSPLGPTRISGVDAHERLEDSLELPSGYSTAAVSHSDEYDISIFRRAEADGATGRRILDRVGQEVEHDLLHFLGVGKYRNRRVH